MSIKSHEKFGEVIEIMHRKDLDRVSDAMWARRKHLKALGSMASLAAVPAIGLTGASARAQALEKTKVSIAVGGKASFIICRFRSLSSKVFTKLKALMSRSAILRAAQERSQRWLADRPTSCRVPTNTPSICSKRARCFKHSSCRVVRRKWPLAFPVKPWRDIRVLPI